MEILIKDVLSCHGREAPAMYSTEGPELILQMFSHGAYATAKQCAHAVGLCMHSLPQAAPQ